MTRLKLYIAGPMRGHTNFNRVAFFRAERKLSNKGIYDIINPVHYDMEIGVTKENFEEKLRDCLSKDCQDVCQCDVIYMLQGWETSLGARAEHALAVALSLTIMYE
tara:strand:+ start:46 stop:363 length:318 start_codon:yes stop_codon:yes gene_type:complete